ncbi:hypothetical protein [Pyrodictium delaneyi]|nr:hypothetical protein [Pyrodictium delaneyi]
MLLQLVLIIGFVLLLAGLASTIRSNDEGEARRAARIESRSQQ